MVYFEYYCSSAFCLQSSDFLFLLLRMAWWPSAWKELSSWLSACIVLFYAVLTVRVPFPFGVWDRMWNSIVSPPDHHLFIYFMSGPHTIKICFEDNSFNE